MFVKRNVISENFYKNAIDDTRISVEDSDHYNKKKLGRENTER